jgi:hypothetical protein
MCAGGFYRRAQRQAVLKNVFEIADAVAAASDAWARFLTQLILENRPARK